MVLCKACDKYLELLNGESNQANQNEQILKQDANNETSFETIGIL